MSQNAFGNDILLKDGDLVAGANGDLFTASDYESKNQDSSKFEGYYNTLFALTNALLTVKGDVVFHPDYGSTLFNLLSSPNSPSTRSEVERAIRETLLNDIRVRDVNSIKTEQKGDQISVKAYVTLVNSNEIIEFVFPNFIAA